MAAKSPRIDPEPYINDGITNSGPVEPPKPGRDRTIMVPDGPPTDTAAAGPPKPEPKATPATASLKVDRALAERFTALAVFHGEDPRVCLERLMRTHVEAHMPPKTPQTP
jgi:hypothetical protein